MIKEDLLMTPVGAGQSSLVTLQTFIIIYLIRRHIRCHVLS